MQNSSFALFILLGAVRNWFVLSFVHIGFKYGMELCNYGLNFEVETMKDCKRITKVQLELMGIEAV